MPKQVDTPSEKELRACLGSAGPVWTAIVRVVEATSAPIDQEWRPSKTDFGRMCLLRHRKRTLLYLTPDAVPDDCDVSGVVMVEQAKSIDFRARNVKRVGPAPDAVLEEVLTLLDACIY